MKTLLAVAFLLVAGNAFAQAPAKPDIIEILELNGEITSGAANLVAMQVEKINDNPKIRAVVLVVNSPGGGASSSAVLYQEVSKIKVPVVAFCEYMCASGGAYAVMSPAVKYIGVRDDTIGGSIGVVAQMTRFNRLLDWAKIDNETFKSGSLKDTGNPTRDMTDADRKYFQSIIDELAAKFYHVVGKARPKITPEQWVEIKSAKIFIGPHIVSMGLADAVMTREQAVIKAKELSGSKTAYTREELRKITRDASEAASMRPDEGWLPRAMKHLDTAMEIVAEMRAGESMRFAYVMPYKF